MNKILGITALILLSGCQSLGGNPYISTASLQDIEKAKAQFEEYKGFTVRDNGVISVSRKLPWSGYRWLPVHIREIGYRTACESLIKYIDAGFVVQFSAQGKGGTNKYYNKEVCETETSTTLYEDS